MDVFNGKSVIYNNDKSYYHRVCRTHKISKGMEYDPETGILMYKSTGAVVHKIDSRGEYVVGGYFLDKHYYCKARDLIWLMMTGGLPIRGVVSFKDSKLDLRWDNLYCVDRDTAEHLLY